MYNFTFVLEIRNAYIFVVENFVIFKPLYIRPMSVLWNEAILQIICITYMYKYSKADKTIACYIRKGGQFAASPLGRPNSNPSVALTHNKIPTDRAIWNQHKPMGNGD